MCAFSTIGVYNNLTARKTRVTVRTTNDKFSCWVYVINNIITKKRLNVCWIFGNDGRNNQCD